MLFLDSLDEVVADSPSRFGIASTGVQHHKVLPGHFCYCEWPLHLEGRFLYARYGPINVHTHPPQDSYACSGIEEGGWGTEFGM